MDPLRPKPRDGLQGKKPDIGPPEIDSSSIVKGQCIGTGSFGKVYSGLCRGVPVAIKVLHRTTFDDRTLRTFRKEVEIMSKIYHPNICLFMGACTKGQLMIVTELLKRNVESLLRDPKVHLNDMKKMKMAKDAALGMNWLHRSDPIVIHRDLKSSNLLVDENFNVKVCDFGLSQIIPRETMIKDKQNAKGTPLWMAPEVMQFKEFNEKCDVYSYGIVLWEILTREEPFQQYQSFDKFKEAICVYHDRPKIPEGCVESLKSLMEDCWAPNPNDRPSFEDIISRINLVIIDCAIRDEVGRQFWTKYFPDKTTVYWSEFQHNLLQFCGMPEKFKEHNNIALKALVADTPNETINTQPIVRIERFGQVVGWFGPMEANCRDIVDENSCFDRMRRLCQKAWFHGDTAMEESQQRLAGLPSGTFLVRFSTSHHGCYTISSTSNTTIKHQRVSYYPEKRKYLLNQTWYDDLQDIIKDSDNMMIPCPGNRYANLFEPQKESLIGYTTN